MNNERVLQTFLDLIRIESPSFREAAMARRCAALLAEMGFSVTVDDTAAVTGSDTGNVIARLEGTASCHIAFSAHLDTVRPCEGIEPIIVDETRDGAMCSVIYSKGDTILSADDKAGIAAILEGVKSVIESGAPRPNITVVLTVGEECGLVGAGAISPDAFVWPQAGESGNASAAKAAPSACDARVPCFVLDADGAPGTIIVAAPYHYLLNATFTGRAAHAGVEPEAGVSAIQAAACAIAAMPLGRIDECTTANIGTISGGSAMNVVAAECTLVGECRSLYEDRVEAQRAAMTHALESAARACGATVEVNWTLDYPAIVLSEDDAIVGKLKRAVAAAGLDARLAATGGGADANVFVTKGANAVTLGIGMTNFHTCDEYIKVKDLEDSARLVEAIIAEYAQPEASEA